MASDMTSVGIAIPKQLIEDMVRAEMVRAMGNHQELMAGIIRHAMEQKSQSYGSQTFFMETVSKLVREEAQKVFEEWLKEHRDALRTAFRQYLDANKHRELNRIVADLTTQITDAHVNVSLVLKNGTY